jgi:hypothetical protein
MEASVPTASANGHSNGPPRSTPSLGDSVPNRQIISRKIDVHRFRFARFHVDVREALQKRWGFSG